MKDEFGENIMKEFAGLPAKAFSYWTDDHDENTNQKLQKSVKKENLS